MDRIILIVGGGGLIGQAVANAHLAAGDTVYIWDNQSNPFNDYNDLAGYDVSYLSIKKVLETTRPDVISHHAAIVGVGRSQYEIKRCLHNNIGGTASWLEHIRDYWMPGLLILAGSMAPYGEGPRFCNECSPGGSSLRERIYIEAPRTTLDISCPFCGRPTTSLPVLDGDRLHPVSMYGISKLAQEQMFRVFAAAHSVPAVSLRYFSVYGSRCNPNNPYTGILSIVGNKIVNASVVELNEDGGQTRDLVHVKDVARAHLATTEAFAAGRLVSQPGEFRAINIGTGEATSLQHVAEKMIANLRPGLPLRFNHKVRVGDIRDSVAATYFARTLLGWGATITIDGAIVQYCDYLKGNWDRFVTPDTCAAEDERLGGLLR